MTEGDVAVDATPVEWQSTACILCECNCGIVVQLDGRNLAKIRGDKEHPASQGYTCNKALRLDHYQNNRSRLTSPMRRRADGSYEEIDWDTAIAEISAGFKRIAETHGGDKIFYYGGGGQGNHLGGAYSGAFLKALGSHYRSNALAQEKTGEAWVDAHLYGGHTRGEFEHAEVSVFIGKNPWMSQSFPRARTVLNEIAKDPNRSMIVIDPVITDTAKMADFHLRVRPGTDAWCLAALAAVLVQEDLVDEAFLADHVTGVEPVRDVLRDVDVGDYALRCGVDEELIRAAARRIGAAASVAVFEDLGIQQAPNSTLCSYLNKLLWILTGNFAKRGGQHLHSSFGPLFRHTPEVGRTPVTGAPIIGGLVPSNVIPQEMLTDHPDRFRAMIVESSNPAHSLADSNACREAFRSLELMVVIDVAMTETARLAHYVLPAASQYEKAEATFFNLEFPHNTFHLRHRLMEPLPGHWPSPRSGRAWCARWTWSTTPTWNRCGAPPARAARPSPRRSCRPSASARCWARCCRSCCTKLWDPLCPKAFPARPPCGGSRRKRRWPIPRRCAGPGTRTATPCSTRSWRAARVSRSPSTSTTTTSPSSPMRTTRSLWRCRRCSTRCGRCPMPNRI